MCTSTSSEGPRLVRIAVPCTQTRVAIEMHSRTRALLSTKPSARCMALATCFSVACRKGVKGLGQGYYNNRSWGQG